jgi:two-component system chemotaxis family response regulator WspR
VVGRPNDIVARYGGEEFAILLPETDADAATRIADACLRSLAALAIPHIAPAAGAHVSLSIGICSLPASADSSPDALIERADQALYQAKRAGRNRAHRFAE